MSTQVSGKLVYNKTEMTELNNTKFVRNVGNVATYDTGSSILQLALSKNMYMISLSTMLSFQRQIEQ